MIADDTGNDDGDDNTATYKSTAVVLLKSVTGNKLIGLSKQFHRCVCYFRNTTDAQLSTVCVQTTLIKSSSTQVMAWLMSTEHGALHCLLHEIHSSTIHADPQRESKGVKGNGLAANSCLCRLLYYISN
jgi:hypothetical protein